jgi:hypothetical protein
MTLALHPSKGGNSFAKGAKPSADFGDQELETVPSSRDTFYEINTQIPDQGR